MRTLGQYEISEDNYFLLAEPLESYIRMLFNSLPSEPGHVHVLSSLTGEPFCGCMDCEMRETIAFLVPRVADLVRDGGLVLQHSDTARVR